MPRRKRVATAGFVYHVLNRAVARERIFRKSGDFQAFEKVLEEAQERVAMRLLSYCIMPNHWHLVVWPLCDGDLSEYLRWLTVTHTKRWHSHHHSIGEGALYQGRFKSFPVQEDGHFLTVCRYVERNALRANLVERAEQWRWCSLWHRANRSTSVSLSAWPVPCGRGWLKYVNGPETEAELQALRTAVKRGAPFGEADWQEEAAETLDLKSSLRPPGRPRLLPRDPPSK